MASTMFSDGVNIGDLYTLLTALKTNFNAMLTKLDAEAEAGMDDDYSATYAITTDFTSNAIDQQDIVDFLSDFQTNFNLVLTKLDSEDLTASNYNSTLAVTDYVNNVGTGNIFGAGMNQGAMLYALNQYVTNFNSLLTKLDSDTSSESLDDTYHDLAVTDTIAESHCSALG